MITNPPPIIKLTNEINNVSEIDDTHSYSNNYDNDFKLQSASAFAVGDLYYTLSNMIIDNVISDNTIDNSHIKNNANISTSKIDWNTNSIIPITVSTANNAITANNLTLDGVTQILPTILDNIPTRCNYIYRGGTGITVTTTTDFYIEPRLFVGSGY